MRIGLQNCQNSDETYTKSKALRIFAISFTFSEELLIIYTAHLYAIRLLCNNRYVNALVFKQAIQLSCGTSFVEKTELLELFLHAIIKIKNYPGYFSQSEGHQSVIKIAIHYPNWSILNTYQFLVIFCVLFLRISYKVISFLK